VDCDDQVWLVKRNYDPDPYTLNVSHVSKSFVFITIYVYRFLDHTFGVAKRCSKGPEVVLGMPCEPHAHLRT